VSNSTGLHLYTSNHLEQLFRELAGIIGRSSGSVFQPEIVVVQSAGMGRWLSLRLAEAHGICANVQFPFPQKFVRDVFQAVLPDAPLTSAFEREVMTWRIIKRLPALLERPEFGPVRNYVSGERPGLKLFQLSTRIASVFDQYLAFRPRMILEWDKGNEGDWQATLWRALSSETPEAHQPALGEKFVQALRAGRSRPAGLPPRISVFGISTLPRFYLQIIEALASRSEVHLFVMEPTPEWWNHIRSRREQAKILKRQPKRSAEQLHLESGNSLLASMGKLGRDFLGLVGDLDPVANQERFVPPDGVTALAQVQRDIFVLRDRDQKEPLPPNDCSIQFHSCHSAMREMEVLHDQLLALLENDSQLQPRDIVVMMPDVAAYAPFVEAVFDTPEDEKQRIPFAIADRNVRAESGVVDTFLAILELSGSRFAVSSVLNILESAAVQQRFGLAEADLGTIRVWIDKAAIRWGIDATHREKFGVPPFGENTWREGLDRLMLGYALPAGGERLFQGILPIDDIEGSFAEVLGNFVEFTSALFATVDQVQATRSLGEWQTTLRQLLDRFFAASNDVQRELLHVRRLLDSLGQVARDAAFDEPVPFDVIVAHLTRAFESANSGAGFLVGRVTFCALKPMRSIPFAVVCLVGMNDAAYPRKSAAPGFDLIAHHPQPGDRSTRDDDRYLFLEALLSARKIFYVSYVGQSIKDNSTLPPSVLVSELLDYLAEEATTESWITKHRLQPFNADYFRGDERLFSYSAENCHASDVARGARSDPPPFLSAPIAEPEEEWRVVDISKLIAFFRNPAQFFLRERLGITLPHEQNPLEDREPFALGPLTKYTIQERLLRRSLAGADLEDEYQLVRAAGQLPPGDAGVAQYRETCREVDEFATLVSAHSAGEPLPAVGINFVLEPWTITGQVEDLRQTGLVRYGLTRLKAKEMLRVWIAHLALNCTATASSATLIGKDLTQSYPPIDNSAEVLRDLLEIYWQGLRAPLPFFPESSYAFAKQTLTPKGRAAALEKARAKWEGNPPFSRPEKVDPYWHLAFRNMADPLGPEMQALALRVFEPLLRAQREEKRR
jgi:exodeoxyribonuclease V gamma subunit